MKSRYDKKSNGGNGDGKYHHSKDAHIGNCISSRKGLPNSTL
ncbi:hypothetical protein N9I19_05695 [Peribacillus sp. CSMR9]|nr:hypothetical protein [Peribacillus sp. CSMR9]